MLSVSSNATSSPRLPVLAKVRDSLKGGSTQMWQQYFHDDSRIVGVDIGQGSSV